MKLGWLEKAILSEAYNLIKNSKNEVFSVDVLYATLKNYCWSYGKNILDTSFFIALKRLKTKRLITKGYVFHPIRGMWDYNGKILTLTEEGKKVVEKLPKTREIIKNRIEKRMMKMLKHRMVQDVHETTKQLLINQEHITVSQIKAALKEKYGGNYFGKEFEKIWSEKRIGKILRKLRFKKTKIVKGIRFWTYRFDSPPLL